MRGVRRPGATMALVLALAFAGCTAEDPTGEDPTSGTPGPDPMDEWSVENCPPMPPPGETDWPPPGGCPPQREGDPHGGPSTRPFDEPSVPAGQPADGRYLMAFHACDTSGYNCRDATEHGTYLATSDDGRAWTLVSGLPYRGSVPDVVRRGDVLYLFNPGTVHRYDLAASTVDAGERVQVLFADGTADNFVDPSPWLDEDGRIVLFYLAPGSSVGDPASCPSYPCTKVFRSATEREGSDGAIFDVDPGSRREVTITQGVASDPDVFRGRDAFVLYVSTGPSVLAFQSSTLKGAYTSIPGLASDRLVENAGGVPAGHYDAGSGRYWTYVHAGGADAARIRLAVHPGLTEPLGEADFTTVLSGEALPGFGAAFTVESPGFTVNEG